MTDRGRATRPVFVIWSPDYTHTSSGIRCLFLLCHNLNRLGYETYISGKNAPGNLFTRWIDEEAAREFRSSGVDHIAIYPEILRQNVFLSTQIVRYLLNRPGVLSDASLDDYGPNDFFIHYADEFVPDGVRSRKLYIPTLDRTIFHEERRSEARTGFLVYAARTEPDMALIPDWVQPRTVLSSREPRDATTLAALYRASRALVTWERTAAITEAIHCGCPVMLIPNRGFAHEVVVEQHRGCGVAVGWDRNALTRAQRSIPISKYRYRLRASCLTKNVRCFAEQARHHFGYCA